MEIILTDMNLAENVLPWSTTPTTARLILANGQVIEGKGLGTTGARLGEICFNTAITGYQEILTDPSYLEQIVLFTFPHIGNVGANNHDIEDLIPQKKHGAIGAIMKADISDPSNYRAVQDLNQWLKERGIIAICNVDTRALTHYLKQNGTVNAIIAHDNSGEFSENGPFCTKVLHERLKKWSGLEGLDLAIEAGATEHDKWQESQWSWESHEYPAINTSTDSKLHIVVIDYGIKRNILRLLKNLGANITLVSPQTSAQKILNLKPDGIFLSNGPGDPAATASYAVPTIQKLIESNLPIFGICLGHQLLALAVKAKTIKMHQGHHGANHPVQDCQTGKVEIVSMNHGFAVDPSSLPENVIQTHISLFDGTNCGLAFVNKPIFSVQHHPEASPGPQDSHYLFEKFKTYINNYSSSRKNNAKA